MKIKDKILSETSEEVKQRVRDTANKLVMKTETLEEAINNYVNYCASNISEDEDLADADKRGFIYGAKWQQERSYSEEEVYDLMDKREHYWVRYKNYYAQSYIPFDEWFEQFKKK